MPKRLFALDRVIAMLRRVSVTLLNSDTARQVCKNRPISKRPYDRSRKLAAIGPVLVAAGIGLGVNGAGAEDAAQGKALRVAVKPIAPFVLKQSKDLTGFSIDLWNALAQSLKVNTAWVEVTTVGDQLQAVKSGKADVAIAA